MFDDHHSNAVNCMEVYHTLGQYASFAMLFNDLLRTVISYPTVCMIVAIDSKTKLSMRNYNTGKILFVESGN